MSKLVMDTSQFNNITDWGKVKNEVDAVIFRIGYRGSHTGVITYDPKFKETLDALKKYDIPYSGYYFPCSINDDEADEEGDFIIKTIKDYGMELSLPFYLDSEVVQRDKSGRSDKLSKADRTRFLNRIFAKLKSANIRYGVYASTYWYSDHLNDDELMDGVSRWVAQYASVNEYSRHSCDIWQYTSKGNINGVSGVVDLSNCYIEITKNYVDTGQTDNETKTTDEYIDDVISTAKNEVGYLEKRSNSNLDDKTANAGYNNYTKYWRDIKNWGLGNYQAQYWCAAFIFWCFVKTFGIQTAKQLLLHAPYINCQTIANLFRSRGKLFSDPKVGDVVVFYTRKSGLFGHTGLVYRVDSSNFYTIEGNTSAAGGVVANGGAVEYKRYSINDSKSAGHKFCRPDYTIIKGESHVPTKENKDYLSKGDSGSNVKEMQKMLIALGYTCGLGGADGNFGSITESAVKSFQGDHGLTVDGVCGKKTMPVLKAEYAARNYLSNTDTGSAVTEMQKMLVVLGYNVGAKGADGIFGTTTDKAVRKFQAEHGLAIDGRYGPKTKAKLESVYNEYLKENEQKEVVQETPEAPEEVSDKAEEVKVAYASAFNSAYGRTFTATGDVYMRAGAGTSYKDITVVKKGDSVKCYGYYTKVNGTPWYLVTYKNMKGFVSGKYLK